MYVYNILKAVLIITFSYVIFLRVSGWQAGFLRKSTAGLAYIFTFSLLIWKLSVHIGEPYKSILIVLLSWFYLTAATKEMHKNTAVSITISYAASQMLYMLSTVVAAFLTITYYRIFGSGSVKENLNSTSEESLLETALLGMVMEIAYTVVLMKRKKRAFTHRKILSNIGVSISGIAVILYSLSRNESFSNEGWILFVSGIALCASGLRNCLKKEQIIAYNDSISGLSEEKIKNKLKESQEDIDRLEHMAHLNSKRIPAYRRAVEELLNSIPDGEWKDRAVEIRKGLREAEEEQSSELLKVLQAGRLMPSSGMVLLDAVFAHMQGRSEKEGIEFDLVVNGAFSRAIEIIKQADLEVLAADLIENALNAVRNGTGRIKSIFVCLRASGGIYEIKVEDSGTLFEAGTFACLGERRITTNADSGGSGIGYMKIFEIIQQYDASLIITEKPPLPNRQTKIVAVRFDGKNGRIIRSYRSDLIKEECGSERWVIKDYTYQ